MTISELPTRTCSRTHESILSNLNTVALELSLKYFEWCVNSIEYVKNPF